MNEQQSPAQRIHKRQWKFKLERQVRDHRDPLDGRLNQPIGDGIHARNQKRRGHAKEGCWMKITSLRHVHEKPGRLWNSPMASPAWTTMSVAAKSLTNDFSSNLGPRAAAAAFSFSEAPSVAGAA